jgi:phosphatidate cytidylyltransferase
VSDEESTESTESTESEEPKPPRTEGVRIIGAEEAARAVDRDDVVQRRGDDEPKFGDVPESPSDDKKPVMRFPLPESSDPSRFGAVPIVRASLDDDESSEDGDAEAGSGSLMPHWTDPPTGEVPEALVSDDDDAAGWSLSTSTPRWRDKDDDFEEDLGDVLGESVGIPTEADRESEDRFFSFDDLDTPEEPATMRIGTSAAASRVSGTEAPDTDSSDGEDTTAATPPSGGRNVPIAVAVAVGMAAVALLAFSLGPAVAVTLVTILIVVAAAEYYNALQQAGHQPATLLGLAATGGLLIAAYNYGYAAYPVVLFLTVVFGLVWYLVGVQEERPVLNLGATMLGIAWVGGLGSFAALMLATDGFGAPMLVAAVIATVGYDVGAFFIGKQFGKNPLSPVSPNKTVEGLVGGMLFAIVLTTLVVGNGLFSSYGGFEGIGNAALLGLAAAILAPLGDLSESLIKRDLGVKDMGAVLPGHGGLLDRFDGLLFVLPTTYFLALLLGL